MNLFIYDYYGFFLKGCFYSFFFCEMSEWKYLETSIMLVQYFERSDADVKILNSVKIDISVV